MSRSSEFKRARKRLLVEPKLQGALLLRAFIYWGALLVGVTSMFIIYRVMYDGPARIFYRHFDDLWFHYGPVVIATGLLMPLVLWDVLKVSNRVCGPMLRMKHAMQDLAEGKSVEEIRFRDHDFWHEFAEAFNQIRQRVQHEQSARQDAEALAEACEPGAAVTS